MTLHLDLDDVAAGNPVAEQELADLRAENARLREDNNALTQGCYTQTEIDAGRYRAQKLLCSLELCASAQQLTAMQKENEELKDFQSSVCEAVNKGFNRPVTGGEYQPPKACLADISFVFRLWKEKCVEVSSIETWKMECADVDVMQKENEEFKEEISLLRENERLWASHAKGDRERFASLREQADSMQKALEEIIFNDGDRFDVRIAKQALKETPK